MTRVTSYIIFGCLAFTAILCLDNLRLKNKQLTADLQAATMQNQVWEDRHHKLDAAMTTLRKSEEALRHETDEYVARLAQLREENDEYRALLDLGVPGALLHGLRSYVQTDCGMSPGSPPEPH